MLRLRRIVDRVGEPLRELLFPRHCIHTGRPMRRGDPYAYLSFEGAQTIEWIERPVDERLPKDFYGDFLARNIQLQLLEHRQPFRRSMSLFTLREAGRSLVHELKYRGGLYLFADIARLVADCPPACAFLSGGIPVPVPLFKTRQRERGFNQSEVIAAALAAQCTGAEPLMPRSAAALATQYGAGVEPLLVRVRATRTQTRLSREQRELNVEGAFALAPGAVINPAARYILVDDVFTTGATIAECARVLREAGASQVDAFTLGHG